MLTDYKSFCIVLEMNALARAVEIAGGQSALARLIGEPVKQGHVWYWLNTANGIVPAEYCIAIENGTGVSRHELRPDVFGAERAANDRAA